MLWIILVCYGMLCNIQWNMYIYICSYICFDWEMIHVEKLRHHVFDVAELVLLFINMGPLTSAWRNSFKRSWCGERYVGHKDPGCE